jgi:hypothetical protein
VLDAVAAFYGVVSVNTVGKLQALPGLDADKAFLGNFDTIASTGSIYTLQDQGIVLSIHFLTSIIIIIAAHSLSFSFLWTKASLVKMLGDGLGRIEGRRRRQACRVHSRSLEGARYCSQSGRSHHLLFIGPKVGFVILVCDEINKYILPGFVLDAVVAFYGVVSVNTGVH